MTVRPAIAALVCALLAPATALAASYPLPQDPEAPGKRPKHAHTLYVCKHKKTHGHRCVHKIQKAVNKAGRGDTIRISNGVYHEGVQIVGRKKAWLRLVGNRKSPRKVRIDSKGVSGPRAQNAVLVNSANQVTLDGLSVRNYKGNGVFLVNVTGYKVNHLVAMGPKGVYGIYAFNSKGGSMQNSETFYHNDGGFYVGQTPRQTKPRRTIVRNIKSWGNALGWSGTNMRYVTISRSEFFNNGIGMAPNALDSEKYVPAEDNVITNNDIFWNNFNYYRGAPFKPKTFGGNYNLPPGIGILMLGADRTKVTGNRIFGNYLVGIGMVIDFTLQKPENKKYREPVGNQITGNDFGLGGNDLNARDLAYDGTGRRNCMQDNVFRSPNLPADENTFHQCPGPDENHQDNSVLAEGLKWLQDDTHEKYWIKHPHAAHKGYNVLEHWNKSYKPGGGL
jgi:hypothetical protein